MPLPTSLAVPLQQVSSPPSAKAQEGLTLHRQSDLGREAVEHSVRTIYTQRYGACIPGFTPWLVSLQDGTTVLAAAGYRPASTGPLYLENYLGAPVERQIANQIGAAPRREDIVEVGHLTATRSGEGRRLMQLLGLHLADQGFHWIVGTFTRELRVMLMRLGVAPLTLGAADPVSLGDSAHMWGSYFEHQPLVLAIHLRHALRQHRERQARLANRGNP